jgi:multisubunit Na+/H+ antiporter MnhG subunit
MPFALIVIGAALFMSGIMDTYKQLGAQVRKDATGYGLWSLAIIMIGSIGYFEPLKPFSRAFLTLIIIGILIANPKFFTEVQNAVKQGPISPAKPTAAPQQSTSDRLGAIIGGGKAEGQAAGNILAGTPLGDKESFFSTAAKAALMFFTGTPAF